MKPRIVLVTGISGSAAQEAVAHLGRSHPDRLRVHNVGAVMNRIAREDRIQYTASNILNAPRDALTALRTAALERIHRAINDDNTAASAGEAVIIHLVFCHATFLLKSGLREGMSLADLKHLGAETLLTLIDAPQDIHDRLTSHPGDYLHLTIESIVKWQEFEVYVTNLFAQVVEKRHFVVPQRQTETLESLLFTNRKPVYVSYPMTHLPAEDKPRIAQFAQELRQRFTVFDPAAVESTHNLKPYYSQVDLQAINDHTIVRDLDWLVGINSEAVIAYMPKIVFSSGMNDELRYGFEVGKETFIVLDCHFDDGIPNLSPFTMYKSKVFFSKDDFFYYLDLAEELQDAYQWIDGQMHESIRRTKNLGGRITFESFQHDCDTLCRYHLSSEHYGRIKSNISDICRRVFDAWYPTASSSGDSKLAVTISAAAAPSKSSL
jgi:adenylate kinase